jgi:Ca2+-binding RTX toxin-like protein
MANIIGTNGNDTLVGGKLADTINGRAGDDTIIANEGNDTLTGGGGNDVFVYNSGDGTDTITDFSGVGKDTNPSAAVIAEVDTIKFQSYDLTARNLLLTQNGSNLEISFERVDDTDDTTLILQNFQLENLKNLGVSEGRPAIGNILFAGQTSITNSFNVLDANSTQTSLDIKNTVIFLNDLDNNFMGLESFSDVINGQGGNDRIDGMSANDLLRGGAGNDTLIGGVGDDTLVAGTGNDSLIGGGGNDNLNADDSTGNKILNGGAGTDTLSGNYSTGNNTLNGGAGNDTFSTEFSTGNNILNGEDGDDDFSLMTPDIAPSSLVTQTVDGGIGEDFLTASFINATERITSTFDAATNSGSITAGTTRLNYSNIEGLDIYGTTYSDNIVGTNGNDYIFGGSSGNDTSYGNDTIFGGEGDDELRLDYSTSNNILNGGSGTDELTVNSSTGNNILNGDDGTDNLSASGDHDDFEGYTNASSGNNTLNGGADDDSLSADYSTGNNLLNGGDGNDYLSASSNSGDTYGFATSGDNTLNGGTGDDTLIANYSTGDNLLNCGDGNDNLSISSYYDYSGSNNGIFGNNTLNGGDGDDSLSFVLYTSPSDLVTQTVDGGTGQDLLSVSYIYATKGITSTFNSITNQGSVRADTILVSYKNIEGLNIDGTVYNDNIVGSSGNDTINGSISGNDTIDGGIGNDLLSLSNYQSTQGITSTFNATTNIGSMRIGTNVLRYKNIERLDISGTIYNDNIVGSNGNDTLYGGGGSGSKDTIDGGAGNDLLLFSNYEATEGKGVVSTFNSTNKSGSITLDTNRVSYKNIERIYINGTDYDDNIVGGGGDDSLYGSGGGNDTIDGGTGDDFLIVDSSTGDSLLKGGDGNDYISALGASGNNILNGGNGDDGLYGGDGADTFVFDSYNQGIDILNNFNAGNDIIQVSADNFGGDLYPSSIFDTDFTIGTSATTSAQRFIYDKTTGALYFDLDGSGSDFTQVQFAKTSYVVSLTENNFIVV